MNRKCPNCKNLTVDTAELERSYGLRCLSCRKIIEVNIGVSIFLSIVFSGGAFLSFKSDWPIPGFFLLFGSLLYASGFKKINARWLPLKHYNDEK